MSILFVEQLTVIDCAYLDAARGLVGESWIVDLELEGELDAQSMVLDFGDVKRRMKQAIDHRLDHCLLIPTLAPELSMAQTDNSLELLFRSDVGAIEHRSPLVAVCLLEAAEVSAAAVEAQLLAVLAAEIPANVASLRIGLRHEAIDGAFYHYVHGLKKHLGQCQRIAHGHRSRIEIRIDGERAPRVEEQIALAWTDIYLGTQADLIARANGRVRYAYQAAEGRFELALPEYRTDQMDTDTTVERIADVIADRIAKDHRGVIEVRVYEGVMKGARARR